jgi:prevent-host-death family protein
MNNNQKGAIAEQAIALAAIRLGIPVLRPLAEHGRYDMALELDGRLLRVQCKSARLDGDVVCIQVAGSRTKVGGYVRTTYAEHEIDVVAAYCGELDRVFVLPASLVAGRHAVQLRLAPARNNQTASINWAEEFELGAIAQLEERLSGTQEVEGSSPSSSIPLKDTVGMDEFDAKIAHYVRYAEAGNEILVTRWGRPVARLGPPQMAVLPQ